MNIKNIFNFFKKTQKESYSEIYHKIFVNGLALKDYSEEIRSDPKMALAAYRTNHESCVYFSKKLLANSEFLLELLKTINSTKKDSFGRVPIFNMIDDSLKNDLSFCSQVLDIDSSFFLKINQSLKNNPSLYLKALKTHPQYIQELNLKDDDYISVINSTKNLQILKYIQPKYLEDIDFLIQIIPNFLEEEIFNIFEVLHQKIIIGCDYNHKNLIPYLQKNVINSTLKTTKQNKKIKI